MRLSIKRALEEIKPDERLILDTEQMLRERLGKQKSGRPLRVNRFAFAACVLAVAGILSVSAFAYYQTPVSYVSIDINPSVELGVNRFDRVVTVKSYNEETDKLLAGKKIAGKKPQEAVKLVLKEAESGGFVKENGNTAVLLVASSKKNDRAEALLDECVKGLDSEKDAVAVYSDTASKEIKKEADSASVSAGKLKLIKMLQELDVSATLEEYRDASVSSLMQRLDYLTSDQYAGAPDAEKKEIQKGIEKAKGKPERGNREEAVSSQEEKKGTQSENAVPQKPGGEKGKAEGRKPDEAQPKENGEKAEKPKNSGSENKERNQPGEIKKHDENLKGSDQAEKQDTEKGSEKKGTQKSEKGRSNGKEKDTSNKNQKK